MAKVFPCESGDEARPFLVRKPGVRDTPFDMREILLRIVSSITGVNLMCHTKLNGNDNLVAYEKIAEKYKLKELYNFICTKEYFDCDAVVDWFKDAILLQAIACEVQKGDFINQVREEATKQFLDELRFAPVQCIKVLLQAVVRSVELLATCPTKVDETRKADLCFELVQGMYLALQDFEENGRQPIKCYVKVWELESDEVDPDAGTHNLAPLRSLRPTRSNVADDGAELVRHLFKTILKRHVVGPYLKDHQQIELVMAKRVIELILDYDPGVVNLLHDGHAIRHLIEAYERFKQPKMLQSGNELCLPRKRLLLQLELQVILVGEILIETYIQQDTLTAFLLAIKELVKHIVADGETENPDYPILETVCHACYKALQESKELLTSDLGANAWDDFESWHIDVLYMGKYHLDLPLAPRSLMLPRSMMGEGAELVKAMVASLSGTMLDVSYIHKLGEEVSSKRKEIATKLGLVPFDKNALTAKNNPQPILELIFEQVQLGCERMKEQCQDGLLVDGRFNMNLQDVLVKKIFAHLDFGSEVLAAMFVTLGWLMIKVACQLEQQHLDSILRTICDATYMALERCQTELEEKFGNDVFQTLEDTYEELLTNAQ